MTFKIFAVELKNFKCFYGEHEFVFPEEHGLFYLTGRNNFNSRLGANAVGKTSLIDSIEWCIYGKTSRGLRAGDIVSWGKKSAAVTVSLLIGEDEIEITRTQNPNSITINGKPASQDEITNTVRLTQEAFNCSVILPQFGNSFFDLSPTEKLNLFSQVMNLDYWLDRSKAASEKASELHDRIELVERSIARNVGKLENLNSQIKDMKSKSADFDLSVQESISELKAEITKKEKLSEKSFSLLKKKMRQQKKSKALLVEVVNEIKVAGEDFAGLSDKQSSLTTDLRTVERHAQELNDQISDMEQMRGTTCSQCKQPIDDKHVEKHQSKLIGKMNKLDDEAKALRGKLKKVQKDLAEARKEVNDLRAVQSEINDADRDLSNEIFKLEREVSRCAEDIERANKNIDALTKKSNPFEAVIEGARKERRRIKDENLDLKRKIKKLKIQHEAHTYWIAGFKRVRLFVIEDALLSLEVEVNNLLIALGLVDWKVTFDVERETKTGSVSKGFSVFIHSPKHSKPVRFESWSGGETQRLRLAGDLGLANLIMEQVGFVNRIEIIDEPSEHMSPEGIEDMVETLHQRAHAMQKQIWLVDHNTMEFSEFSGVLTAEMDAKGQASLTYG